MTSGKESGFRLVSLALVANNKELGSGLIQATPIEKITMVDGELASLPYDQEVEGKDASEASYQAKVKVDLAVEAKWINMHGSNRSTPPDVRRGERVWLYQYADNADFYWTTAGLGDEKLRKLETVVYRFSGTADEEEDSTSPENSYVLEVSTHTGMVTFRTSKANDEFCVYAFQFNLKEGRVVLTDELGNEIVLNSKDTMISFTNAEGTKIELDKRKIFAFAPDSITLQADKSILMKTKDFKIETQNYTLKTSTNLIDAANSQIKGNVTAQGTWTFQQRIFANGMTSSASVVGPSETI